ncbi:hypothetical protein AB0L59_30230 [Streptomyces sp. NPDC052109]|uniref:hypothetical protein n=1 Tax=Streptomyces sp. NPDC052109 TaxID=3155527 RepID=UPI003419FA4D
MNLHLAQLALQGASAAAWLAYLIQGRPNRYAARRRQRVARRPRYAAGAVDTGAA